MILERYSIRKPLSKTENKSEVPQFQTTRLGQTPEIAARLRKLNRNRLIRYQERVDAFTGYYPTRIKDDPERITDMRAKGKLSAAAPQQRLKVASVAQVPMIGTPKLHAFLAEYHAEKDADRRAALKYQEVCERIALNARKASEAGSVGRGSDSDNASSKPK